MGVRWRCHEAQLYRFVFLILVLEVRGCLSLNFEGLALLQFRAKVEFDPYGALANWDPNECDPCMWSGVHCLNGKVHMLDLNGLDLEGVLAPELGNLSHLVLLDLSKNRLSGTIPQQFGQLTTLEVLDLRDNKLTGTVPPELGQLHSLKRLLLCDNRFKGSIPVKIAKLNSLTDLQFDEILTTTTAGVGCASRKFGHCVWQSVLKQSKKSYTFQIPTKGAIIRYLNLFPLFKLGSEPSQDHANNCCRNLTDLPTPAMFWNIDDHVSNVRRILAEQSNNLAAILPKGGPASPLEPVIVLPSRSSGSFPAIPNRKKLSPPISPPTPVQEHKSDDKNNPGAESQPTDKRSSAKGKTGNSVKIIIWVSSAVFLLVIVAAIFFIFRSSAARTIVPWKTGLSGQLQKAFVTGAPKLNRVELVNACEDFSNILNINDGISMVYKGTLSSGVEIAVVSTAISSIEDWSKRSEFVFRKEIDALSRVNHKNFVNLIGYCEEDEPFTRMMVFEYAPNGTLFEHLHVKEVEHLDWNARTRIIMGTAYCLEYMHDLNPPVAHFNLNCKEILLTDDYAAKIANIGFWADLITKSKAGVENESEHSELPPIADVDTNIHSFGILLLEIISGKLPYSEEEGDLINTAAEYMDDKSRVSQLIDPTLKSYKENELEVVCEVIQSCIQKDEKRRPSMKEVVQKLRQAINISTDAAIPRLSPLWWAELEILSAEAA
ncbi:hypothetical protein BUALT_Bualt18G0115900 [Buddleja alternifolia]|uniref:Protein kinase domain-containing protein n=1 Tax=Buddleja alternifolia TaxID=168488 RepID=A0AAV6WAQ9_9LAMI|nr:hypothetical protein BUALT_Bualt18G0115900 [Buddleja alternifolia]